MKSSTMLHTLINVSIRQILRKKIFGWQIFTVRLRPWHRIRKKKNKTKQSSGLCPTLDRSSDVRYLLLFSANFTSCVMAGVRVQ